MKRVLFMNVSFGKDISLLAPAIRIMEKFGHAVTVVDFTIPIKELNSLGIYNPESIATQRIAIDDFTWVTNNLYPYISPKESKIANIHPETNWHFGIFLYVMFKDLRDQYGYNAAVKMFKKHGTESFEYDALYSRLIEEYEPDFVIFSGNRAEIEKIKKPFCGKFQGYIFNLQELYEGTISLSWDWSFFRKNCDEDKKVLET